MSEAETKVTVKSEAAPPAKAEAKPVEARATPEPWRPFETLRREVDRLFDEFDRGSWPFSLRRSLFDVEPFWRRAAPWGTLPAIDIQETDKGYEIAAELPGITEKDVEVKVSDDMLTISGEKKETKEEKREGSYLSERRYGAFERSFRIPDGVDADKIAASFAKGVLTVTLPKKAEAQKPVKKIAITAG